MRNMMIAKKAHFLTPSTDLEIKNPVRTHALAAVTPIAMSAVGHKIRYPNVDLSRKNPCTVPPVKEATARDPKKSVHSARY